MRGLFLTLMTALSISFNAIPSQSAAPMLVPATGAAPNRPSNRSETINVTDFGAKCDGLADDTFALQSAASASAGKTVQLPVGTCKISGTIKFTGDFTHLRGQGTYVSSILQTAPGVDSIVFESTSPTTKSIYGGEISELWLRRDAEASKGAALRLNFPNGFYASNVDIRDHFEDIVIDGGSAIYFTNTTVTAGGKWPHVLTGSSLIRIGCGNDAKGGCRTPGEIFFAGLDARSTENNYVDAALRIEAVDGLWLTGAHVGFSQTQVLLAPVINHAGIQSVYFTNVGVDGNISGHVGLLIPKLVTTGGFVKDVVLVGGGVEDLSGNGVEIREPTAQLTITGTPIRHVRGWAVFAQAASWLSFSNALIDQVGSSDSGGISIGDVNQLILTGLGFSLMSGICINDLTVLTDQRKKSAHVMDSLSFDSSCDDRP